LRRDVTSRIAAESRDRASEGRHEAARHRAWRASAQDPPRSDVRVRDAAAHEPPHSGSRRATHAPADRERAHRQRDRSAHLGDREVPTRASRRVVAVITAIREERLLVVSDIHLGNPLYRRRHRFVDFLRFACQNDYPVCINGDGVDIVQNSSARLTHDLRGCNREFAQFAARGLPIYYTVGNHDIVLEQFLDDWGVVRVAPFLNVDSGDRRIRIEHGHVYDEMFVKYPRTYDVITMLGSAMLRV